MELILVLFFIGVLGIGAWWRERPQRPRDETIADAQSTSERGLW